MQNSWPLARRLAALLFFAACALAVTQPLIASDKPADSQKYTAILIWGADDHKPADPNLKPVDGKLVEKFTKYFKWKNYHEVNRKDIDLKVNDPKHVVLSDKCEVKLSLTEKDGLEVELFGEKKSVYKCKQAMPLKDILILAGDDKNATAWFVVLKPRD